MNARAVECPLCHTHLWEPQGVSFYKCSNCDNTLQATWLNAERPQPSGHQASSSSPRGNAHSSAGSPPADQQGADAPSTPEKSPKKRFWQRKQKAQADPASVSEPVPETDSKSSDLPILLMDSPPAKSPSEARAEERSQERQRMADVEQRKLACTKYDGADVLHQACLPDACIHVAYKRASRSVAPLMGRLPSRAVRERHPSWANDSEFSASAESPSVDEAASEDLAGAEVTREACSNMSGESDPIGAEPTKPVSTGPEATASVADGNPSDGGPNTPAGSGYSPATAVPGLTKFDSFAHRTQEAPLQGLREALVTNGARLTAAERALLEGVFTREAELRGRDADLITIRSAPQVQTYYGVMQQLLNVMFHGSRAAIGGLVRVKTGSAEARALGAAVSVAAVLGPVLKEILSAIPGGHVLGSLLKAVAKKGAEAKTVANLFGLARICRSVTEFEAVSESVARALAIYRKEALLKCPPGESWYMQLGRSSGLASLEVALTSPGRANEGVQRVAARDASAILSAIQNGMVSEELTQVELIGKLTAIAAGQDVGDVSSPSASPTVHVGQSGCLQGASNHDYSPGSDSAAVGASQAPAGEVASLERQKELERQVRKLEEKLRKLQAQVEESDLDGDDRSDGPMLQQRRAQVRATAAGSDERVARSLVFQLEERVLQLEAIEAARLGRGAGDEGLMRRSQEDIERRKLGLDARSVQS